MSPLPDRSPQSSKSPLPDEITPIPEQPSAASASTSIDASTAKEAATDRASDAVTDDAPPADPPPLVPKRPLMRPVSRPQPPAPPPVTPAPAAQTPVAVVSPSPKSDIVSVTPAESSSTSTPDATAEQDIIRQQPIPPPSEPKQYRAIGLVRGRYTPSDEQFTRGAMMTSDGTEVEAVLLGRVMSLVRNHLDLEQEHLWVVYPRTREMRQDLHVQIVGVWEPEKLSKATDAESDGETDDEAIAESATPSEATPAKEPPAPASHDSGLDENYFSIRGEVVFYSAEEQQIVVKIQQAPRKTADREKAFKLRLDGVLSSPKALGYFWDLQVERRAAALVVTSGTPIGLVPPKKKTASAGFKRGGDRRGPQRKARPAGARSAAPASAPRREPLPKPVKRTEQGSEG
ncbi:MAG: hypothetical protein ACAF41_31280 [Leptolyngbya sp. BL-A-14]